MISEDEFKEKFNEVMSLDGKELADFLNALVEAGKGDIARVLLQQWKIRREKN